MCRMFFPTNGRTGFANHQLPTNFSGNEAIPNRNTVIAMLKRDAELRNTIAAQVRWDIYIYIYFS